MKKTSLTNLKIQDEVILFVSTEGVGMQIETEAPAGEAEREYY